MKLLRDIINTYYYKEELKEVKKVRDLLLESLVEKEKQLEKYIGLYEKVRDDHKILYEKWQASERKVRELSQRRLNKQAK